MERCKQHKNLTIIERAFVENVIHVSEGEPPEEANDWHGDPVKWHDPQPVNIAVICSDCGFERIYGARTALPKWVRAVWKPYEE